VLTTQPAADVTINLATSPSSQVITAPASLTFTPSDWNQAQTVTLSAVDDTVHEATLVASVAHSVSSADSNYASLTPDPVTVTVIDNDPANPPTSLPIVYGGPWTPLPVGFAGTGLGSPYTTSLGGDTGTGSAKFDDSGDSLVISFNQSPSTLSYHLKGNPSSGTATAGTFLVQQSPDGSNYSTLHTVTNKNNTEQSYTHTLSATTRFVKFIYQQKTGGNIQFDKLSITGSPWLAWQSSYGLSGPDAEPTFDFDKDGFMNLAEYALGGSPVDASTSISPVLTRLPGIIRITTVIRINDPALQSTAETTTDPNLPASWTSTGVRQLTSVSQSGVAPGFERMVFEVDDGGSPRRFIRLNFVLDEPAP
jgi:hypothetical protein